MEIQLLGPLEVESQGRLVEVAGRRLRLLLAVLALQAGRVVEAERLVDLLWPPASLPADPANALQALVSRLRRALESAGAGEWVVARPPGYLLAVEPDQVDALRFERLAADGHAALAAGRWREAAATLRVALDLWRGPALVDFAGEPFAAGTATRLQELRLGAVEDRFDAELALGEHARLVGELETLVAEHPLRERLHALLMRALYGAGRQAEALAAYRRARQVLADQAGLDPGPELRRLEQAVLAQDPSLSMPAGATVAGDGGGAAAGARRGDAGAAAGDGAGAARVGSDWAPAAARPGRATLPAPLTSFVGREAELAEVLELLGRHRLVTLTGPGGVGKTRLALEAARRLGDSAGGQADRRQLAPDGAWVVELAAVRDGGLLPQLVLDTLGLGEERPRLDAPAAPAAAEDRLLDALRPRRALLLLDNCEHLAEPAAELAGRLLEACAGMRVLATSREPLRVPGEARWPVPTLPVPPPGPVDAKELHRFAATQLFVERAAAAVPGYQVRDQADASAVAEVCRRLDGLPLAIELAAARVAALPPRELAARLHDRFRLLTAGARTALPRQQTLRAVVEWSWELLDRSERTALRRLAVFTGGCSLRAAEAVCAGGDLPAEEVADTVARLVDKSLLAAGPAPAPPAPWWPGIEALGLPPHPEPAGREPRYRMLETVQAYAALRLAEAGEADEVARAHARWAVHLAETADQELRGRDQLVWFERLTVELDNLRAALAWTIDRGEAALAVRLVAALGGFLLLAGHREEAARGLRAALALPGPVPDRARGQALYALVWADTDRGSSASSAIADQAEQALERGATSDDERVVAGMLAATIRLFTDPGDAAQRALDKSMEEVDRVGGWPAAYVRLMRGFARATRGDHGGLREDGEECLARFRELGDRWGVVQAQELLSSLDLQEGRYDEATARLEEGLRNAWELRISSEVAVQLCRLAHVATLTGDLDRAESWLAQALAAGRELGLPTETAFAHAGLGLVAQRRGEVERARREHDQALALFGGRHNRRHPLAVIVLRWLGLVAEEQGDLARAAAMHRDIVEQAKTHASPLLLALALSGLAAVACASGDPEQAAVLLGAATAAERAARQPLPRQERPDLDRATGAARRALGEKRFAEAFARGEALSFEEVVTLAEQG